MGIITSRRLRSRCASQSGQTTIFVLLGLAIFLFAAIAFAVDIANLWFHRQAAQNVADSACTAAAMDMLFTSNSVSLPSPAPGGETTWGGLPSPAVAGTTYDCATLTTAAPCQYAALNGYNGAGIVAGTGGSSVKFSFPSSFSGVPACSGTPPPPICLPGFPALPTIQVNVGEAVRVYFAGMVSGSRTMNVSAQATCGVVAALVPVPLLVLDPVGPSLSLSGTPNIAIVGGPSTSIQVNSNNAAAVGIGGSSTIDLSKGGPSGTGSALDVYGGPTTAPGGFVTTGSCCTWTSGASPISDPLASLAAPSKPAAAPAPTSVALGVDGCPDAGGCYEYVGGDYPSGICVGKGGCTNKTYDTAIFEPGIYYLEGNLNLKSNSTVRPSTQAGDGSGGTMFYFSGTSSISVDANSGKSIYAFSTASGSGSLSNGLKCTSTSTLPSNIGATLSVGNLLLAPCTGTYGDPLVAEGLTDPAGTQRGILFFQDRSAQNVTSGWGGGGAFALVGTMYIHSCNSSGTGTGCGTAGVPGATAYYTDTFSFGGNSGSGSYVLGNIIGDNFTLSGTPGITMDLNPNAAYYILKASLLQ